MSEGIIDFFIAVFVIILSLVIIYGISILKECKEIIKQCDDLQEKKK